MSPHKDWQCDAVPNRRCRLGDAQTQVPPVPHMRQSLASPAMRLLFRSPPVAFCIRASRLLLVGELSSATWLHIASPKLRASRRGRGARLESALSLLMLQPGYVDGMACGWHSVSAWRHAACLTNRSLKVRMEARAVLSRGARMARSSSGTTSVSCT